MSRMNGKKTHNTHNTLLTLLLNLIQLTVNCYTTKEKEWTDCVQSDIRAFGMTGDWETMAVKAEVWVEAVTKGGRRFMAAWRQEEEDAARHRQEKREATRLGKLQSHTEA